MSEYTVNVNTLQLSGFSVQDLKDRLNNLGVEYPEEKQPKQFYFDLYKETLTKLQRQDNTPPPTTKQVSRSSTNKRRRSKKHLSTSTTQDDDEEQSQSSQNNDIMIDEGEELPQEEEDQDEPPKKKTKVTSQQQQGISTPVKTTPPQKSPVVELRTPAVSPIVEQPISQVTRKPTDYLPPVDQTQVNSNGGIRQRKSVGILDPSLRQKIETGYSTPTVNHSYDEINSIPASTPSSTIRQVTTPSSLKRDGRLSLISTRTGYSGIADISVMTNDVEESFGERKCITGTIVAVFWLILVAVVYLFIVGGYNPPSNSVPHGRPYCDSELDGVNTVGNEFLVISNSAQDEIVKTTDCQSCPKFGYCAQGRLIDCQKPHIIRNAICVESEEVTEEAMKMVTYIQKTLSEQAGSFECGQCQTRYKSRTDLRQDLATIFASRDEDFFERAYTKMEEVIKESSQNLELKEEVITIDQTDADGNAQKVQLDVISSTSPALNVVCRVKKLVQENLIVLGAVVVLLIVALIGNVVRRRNEEYERKVRDVTGSVISALKQHKAFLIPNLRDELRDAYAPRFDLTDSLWDDVTGRIRSDSRIEESNEDRGLQWRWISPETSNLSIGQSYQQESLVL
jgi:hypothetical protein